MNIRTRVGAIIIEDNKLLLVQGRKTDYIWTPGGKIEENETDEDCLRREIKEELDCDVVSFKYIDELIGKSPLHKNLCWCKMYLTKIKGYITPKEEISKIIWLTHDEFYNKKYNITPVTEEMIVNYIIKKGIWENK